jgi:uncharacterized protein
MVDAQILFLIFLSLLFFAALLYSSVGHGGASAYLAIMALLGMETGLMKSSALALNIIVSFIAFVQYYRKGHFDLKLFALFAIASVPASFLGAVMEIDPVIFRRILAFCLLFAIIRLLGIWGKDGYVVEKSQPVLAIGIGGAIGLLSGMIGIGGGILLSPVLIFLHWANMKTAAGISALFIFVNSLAGVIGLLSSGAEFHPQLYYMLAIVPLGGVLGSYWGSQKLGGKALKYALAVVLMIAGVKLVLV